VSGGWPVCARRKVVLLMVAASTVPLKVAVMRLPPLATPVVPVATVRLPFVGSVMVTATVACADRRNDRWRSDRRRDRRNDRRNDGARRRDQDRLGDVGTEDRVLTAAAAGDESTEAEREREREGRRAGEAWLEFHRCFRESNLARLLRRLPGRRQKQQKETTGASPGIARDRCELICSLAPRSISMERQPMWTLFTPAPRAAFTRRTSARRWTRCSMLGLFTLDGTKVVYRSRN
jgi:hypothetical protein